MGRVSARRFPPTGTISVVFKVFLFRPAPRVKFVVTYVLVIYPSVLTIACFREAGVVLLWGFWDVSTAVDCFFAAFTTKFTRAWVL